MTRSNVLTLVLSIAVSTCATDVEARSLSKSLKRIEKNLIVKAQIDRAVAQSESSVVRDVDRNRVVEMAAVAAAEVALRDRAERSGVRIVGESGIVRPGEFPEMVGLAMQHPLTREFSIICGGSVVSDKFVLTAAHCNAIPSKYLFVYVGPPSLEWKPENLRPVKRFLNHPNFETVRDVNGETIGLKNDIAVVETVAGIGRPSIKLDRDTAPSNVATSALVLGWGTINTITEETSDVLLFGRVPVRSDDFCKEAYPEAFDQSQICAGDGRTDSCWGDSGGPLIDASTRLQIGIVSYGTECGLEEYPGVYSRVSNLYKFVDDTIASAHQDWAWRLAW